MKIGRITFSDPTLSEAKQNLLHAEIERVIASTFQEPTQFVNAVIPPDRDALRAALIRLCDEEQCPLVFTTSGTGPSPDDFTPDITLEILERRLPGFGEIIRTYSFERFKVSILSRTEAGIRGKSLVINLPGRPKPIKFCLRLIREGIAEGLKQITGKAVDLKSDEVVIPLEKYLPFLKRFRVKPDPRGEHVSL